MTNSWIQYSAKRLCIAALVASAGCTSVNFEHSVERINQEAGAFSAGNLSLAHSPQEHAQRAEAVRLLLEKPLGQKQAVQLALLNSPALQALLAQGWAESAEAAQGGRTANPVFSFERLLTSHELELGRALSFGLLDVLTLPVRQGVARYHIEQTQLRLTGEVVDQVTQVRQAWVRAVAAAQTLGYARQVYESAEAGAELARRMQAAGNFSRLNRAREQAFYADAATRLATASHQAMAAREELVRLLGLNEEQAEMLKLPERLPDLPQQALEPKAVGALATTSRLDIRLAQAALDAAARAQGLNRVTSLTDIELTVRRNTLSDRDTGASENQRGYEISVRLPVFDWGDLHREAMHARTLAAFHQLEDTLRTAGSSLRENYSAYRTAHDVARHYRDEVVPLRKVISEENLLRYNGMLIGVFELLADARDQVNTVMAAIAAERQFWLADAALQASVIGRPTSVALSLTPSAVGASTGAGH